MAHEDLVELLSTYTSDQTELRRVAGEEALRLFPVTIGSQYVHGARELIQERQRTFLAGIDWALQHGWTSGDDDPAWTDLDRAASIVVEIKRMHGIMTALKVAFVHRGIDGGAKAAFEHPLYIAALNKKSQLDDRLTQLITEMPTTTNNIPKSEGTAP